MAQHTILFVDDNQAGLCLLEEAIVEVRPDLHLLSLNDGEDCLDLLRKKGVWADTNPLPNLILLDLNMPGIDGRAILFGIKNDPELTHLPVIILSSSASEQDIQESYKSGANSYITKPLGFDELKDMLRDLLHYWLDVAQIPVQGPRL